MMNPIASATFGLLLVASVALGQELTPCQKVGRELRQIHLVQMNLTAECKAKSGDQQSLYDLMRDHDALMADYLILKAIKAIKNDVAKQVGDVLSSKLTTPLDTRLSKAERSVDQARAVYDALNNVSFQAGLTAMFGGLQQESDRLKQHAMMISYINDFCDQRANRSSDLCVPLRRNHASAEPIKGTLAQIFFLMSVNAKTSDEFQAQMTQMAPTYALYMNPNTLAGLDVNLKSIRKTRELAKEGSAAVDIANLSLATMPSEFKPLFQNLKDNLRMLTDAPPTSNDVKAISETTLKSIENQFLNHETVLRRDKETGVSLNSETKSLDEAISKMDSKAYQQQLLNTLHTLGGPHASCSGLQSLDDVARIDTCIKAIPDLDARIQQHDVKLKAMETQIAQIRNCAPKYDDIVRSVRPNLISMGCASEMHSAVTECAADPIQHGYGLTTLLDVDQSILAVLPDGPNPNPEVRAQFCTDPVRAQYPSICGLPANSPEVIIQDNASGEGEESINNENENDNQGSGGTQDHRQSSKTKKEKSYSKGEKFSRKERRAIIKESQSANASANALNALTQPSTADSILNGLAAALPYGISAYQNYQSTKMYENYMAGIYVNSTLYQNSLYQSYSNGRNLNSSIYSYDPYFYSGQYSNGTFYNSTYNVDAATATSSASSLIQLQMFPTAFSTI